MLYFKDENGEIFAYSSIEERHIFGSECLVALANEEINLKPIFVPKTSDEVRETRRLAYANPLTGSDPLYIEYQRSVATGASEEEVQASRSAWLERAEEIAARYPWPE